MDRRLNAQHELATELLFAQRMRHFVAVRVNQFNHFFHCRAQFGIDLCFVAAVNPAQHKLGATANKALVFIAPLDKFRVPRRLFFDLFTHHKSSFFNRVQRPPHISFLVMPGVIAWTATQSHPNPFRMSKVSMAPFAASVYKPALFQVGNKLAHFARHFSIKLVSQRDKGVNNVCRCAQAGQAISVKDRKTSLLLGTGDIGEDDADAVIRNRAVDRQSVAGSLGVNTPFTFGAAG